MLQGEICPEDNLGSVHSGPPCSKGVGMLGGPRTKKTVSCAGITAPKATSEQLEVLAWLRNKGCNELCRSPFPVCKVCTPSSSAHTWRPCRMGPARAPRCWSWFHWLFSKMWMSALFYISKSFLTQKTSRWVEVKITGPLERACHLNFSLQASEVYIFPGLMTHSQRIL